MRFDCLVPEDAAYYADVLLNCLATGGRWFGSPQGIGNGIDRNWTWRHRYEQPQHFACFRQAECCRPDRVVDL
jgi:hypothetical protein